MPGVLLCLQRPTIGRLIERQFSNWRNQSLELRSGMLSGGSSSFWCVCVCQWCTDRLAARICCSALRLLSTLPSCEQRFMDEPRQPTGSVNMGQVLKSNPPILTSIKGWPGGGKGGAQISLSTWGGGGCALRHRFESFSGFTKQQRCQMTSPQGLKTATSGKDRGLLRLSGKRRHLVS